MAKTPEDIMKELTDDIETLKKAKLKGFYDEDRKITYFQIQTAIQIFENELEWIRKMYIEWKPSNYVCRKYDDRISQLKSAIKLGKEAIQ